jgi:hypothetical protein
MRSDEPLRSALEKRMEQYSAGVMVLPLAYLDDGTLAERLAQRSL